MPKLYRIAVKVANAGAQALIRWDNGLMPKFDDSLRGYAFATMKRDGFKCRYCGLDGSSSYSSWLALSEDHLLPKGHPNRDNRDFIVCACRACNEADNQFFVRAKARGVSFDGKSAEELIDQRRPYVEETRLNYHEFWEANVQSGEPSLPPAKEIEYQRARFLLKAGGITNDDQAATNAIVAALQHNRTYASEKIPRLPFRLAFQNQLIGCRPLYSREVTDVEHCSVIEKMSNDLSTQFSNELKGGRLRIGTVQKALNLFLKTIWCLDSSLPAPPHCPVDRVVLQKAGIEGNWTELDSISTYADWIKRLRQFAEAQGFDSLAVWELCAWNQ